MRAGQPLHPPGDGLTVKTQQALSDEQERIRIEGLRALARIIARRALTDAASGASRSRNRTADDARNGTRARGGIDPRVQPEAQAPCASRQPDQGWGASRRMPASGT